MPLEIERKFLLSAPTPDDEWPVTFTDYWIVQTGLVREDPRLSSERVRFRSPVLRPRTIWLTHTKKVRVSDGIHEEEEQEISGMEYLRLMLRRDRDMIPIRKTRRVFEWLDRTFELDTFEHPFEGLQVLEVELPDVAAMSYDPVKLLPPFLKIEREVTQEPAYTNAALARLGRRP